MRKPDPSIDEKNPFPEFPSDIGADRLQDFSEAVAIVRLEGYIPLKEDMQALGRFADGSANLEEYVGLCLEATPIRTPMSSRAPDA